SVQHGIGVGENDDWRVNYCHCSVFSCGLSPSPVFMQQYDIGKILQCYSKIIGGSVRNKIDLQQFSRIIQLLTVKDFLTQNICFIITRNNQADRWFEIVKARLNL